MDGARPGTERCGPAADAARLPGAANAARLPSAADAARLAARGSDTGRLAAGGRFAYARGAGRAQGGRGGGSVDGDETRQRIAALRMEHGDLDAAIAALASRSVPDQLSMARLKKRKLRLKDEIAVLEDRLIPDIIA